LVQIGIWEHLLSFGPESFVFPSAIQKYKAKISKVVPVTGLEGSALDGVGD
jgi:hypothetical protein